MLLIDDSSLLLTYLRLNHNYLFKTKTRYVKKLQKYSQKTYTSKLSLLKFNMYFMICKKFRNVQ